MLRRRGPFHLLMKDLLSPFQEPAGAPEPAPGATSGGLTAEQKARIEANKARALALRRERAAQAAEGRAAEGGAAAAGNPEGENCLLADSFVWSGESCVDPSRCVCGFGESLCERWCSDFDR